MGVEELKWCQLAYHQLMSQPRSPHKPMIKAEFSGRMVSSGISDVAFASVHSEETHMKKLMLIIIIIIMNHKK